MADIIRIKLSKIFSIFKESVCPISSKNSSRKVFFSMIESHVVTKLSQPLAPFVLLALQFEKT